MEKTRAGEGRLGESVTDEIEGRVRRYQSRAVVLAILVHFLIIFTGIITLVILKQPLIVFVATHATVQALAIVNAIIGPTIYRKYLTMKHSKGLDIY